MATTFKQASRSVKKANKWLSQRGSTFQLVEVNRLDGQTYYGLTNPRVSDRLLFEPTKTIQESLLNTQKRH